MEPNKLDTLFRNKIDGHVEPVSSNAWESVQQGLKANKSTKRPVLWYIAASISIVLLSTLSIYNYYNGNNDSFTTVAKIDLNSNQISLSEGYGDDFSAPKAKAVDPDPLVNSSSKGFHQRTASSIKNKPQYEKEFQRNTAELPKLASLPIVINKEEEPTKTANFKKIDSEIMVNINYVAQQPDKLNEFKQTTNRIKSLASELNLADLRSAKNELFASALTFEKKHNN